MNRLIKFRAMPLSLVRQWVYGSLVEKSARYGAHYYILTRSMDIEEDDVETHIHPSSICQFTGLIDRNGKHIYEDDIVEWNKELALSDVITFNSGCFTLSRLPMTQFSESELEVIGNLHEDEKPKILKKKKRK